jgi:tripartite-type tricarboxylate transporter receptor subunit TctC
MSEEEREDTMAIQWIARIIAALTLAHTAAMADPVADFYRGKTITLMVSSGAGGGMDIHARMVAPYLAERLPGKPNIIVQNRPGAGGIVAANYLYTAAPKDGSLIAVLHSTVPFAPLFGEPRATFDATKFSWIGRIDKASHLCIAWHTAPAKKIADVMTNELIVGSTGPGSGMSEFPYLMNRLLGTKFKVVTGYKGGNDIYLAMERGEVHGRCVLTLNALRSIHPDWLRERKINILLQLAREASHEPELKGVPVLYDLAKDDHQRGVMELMFGNQELERPVLAPPGVPAERLAALRTALREALADPKLKAEVEQRRMTLDYASGEFVAGVVARAYAAPKSVVETAIQSRIPTD